MLLDARQIERSMGKARIILLAIADITTRKEMEQEIKRLAYHDPLTNLPKRMLFTDRLNMAKILSDRDRKKVALMMLDLDKFKAINDALGHHIGDLLLQVAAE